MSYDKKIQVKKVPSPATSYLSNVIPRCGFCTVNGQAVKLNSLPKAKEAMHAVSPQEKITQ